MQSLGQLAWWRVSNVQLPHSVAESLLPELGFAAPPPARVLPVDSFRRLTAEVIDRWEDDDQQLTLSLHVVEYPRKNSPMLVRHIVRHNVTSGEYWKVGEVVFYKPPKGQPSKGRLRIDVQSPEPRVREYADRLRTAYEQGQTNLDAQAVRRLIRSHLAAVNAVPLAGPYFFPNAADVAPLAALFDRLGEDSVLHQMPVTDTEDTRRMLASPTEGDHL